MGDGAKSGMLGSVEQTFPSKVLYHPDPKNLAENNISKYVPFFLDKTSTSIN